MHIKGMLFSQLTLILFTTHDVCAYISFTLSESSWEDQTPWI